MPIDILIFAAVAGFFVWKLRQVLGQKHGEERERPNRFTMAEKAAEEAKQQQQESGPVDAIIDGEATEVLAPRAAIPAPQGSLADAIASVRMVDRSFDEKQFLAGARMAFTMIVEAFAKGDLPALKSLLKPAVYGGFETEIERRQSAGETMQTTILRILAADIASVRVDGPLVLITVDFTSEQQSATTNQAGEVIDGDLKKPQHVAESWTFERDSTSPDPTWFLVSTRIR